MTEIVVGIEQLLNLLRKENINYTITNPDEPNRDHYGTIETPNGGYMTWRKV